MLWILVALTDIARGTEGVSLPNWEVFRSIWVKFMFIQRNQRLTIHSKSSFFETTPLGLIPKCCPDTTKFG
jgi:hypothetical protein